MGNALSLPGESQKRKEEEIHKNYCNFWGVSKRHYFAMPLTFNKVENKRTKQTRNSDHLWDGEEADSSPKEGEDAGEVPDTDVGVCFHHKPDIVGERGGTALTWYEILYDCCGFILNNSQLIQNCFQTFDLNICSKWKGLETKYTTIKRSWSL